MQYKFIPPPTMEQLDRFMSRLDRTGDCWLWQASLRQGYGQYLGFAAHRVAYTWLHGPIPDGLTLDHVCRNRSCCNPGHLEPVTVGENTRRMLQHWKSVAWEGWGDLAKTRPKRAYKTKASLLIAPEPVFVPDPVVKLKRDMPPVGLVALRPQRSMRNPDESARDWQLRQITERAYKIAQKHGIPYDITSLDDKDGGNIDEFTKFAGRVYSLLGRAEG